MTNPQDPYNETPGGRSRFDTSEMYEEATARSSGAMWGWIAGGAVVVLLLLFFAFGSDLNGDRAADTAPPTTTSQTAPAAGSASENTGRATQAPPPAVRDVTPRPPQPSGTPQQ